MIEKTPCGEREALVEYLYGEGSADERARFDAHLAVCAECRDALDGMRGVRAELAGWTVPEVAPGVGGAGLMETAGLKADGYTVGETARHARPWWASGALAAAAVILLAVAAAIANLEITYGSSGFSIRTGWAGSPSTVATQTAQATPASVPGGASAPVLEPATSPWREDLSAMERRLRSEFQAASATPRTSAPLSPDSARLLQRVQDLIEQSELRQRRELALRMAQVVRDFDAQRQTDLVRIQQGLGQLEGNTAADRQILNYLVRASQRQ